MPIKVPDERVDSNNPLWLYEHYLPHSLSDQTPPDPVRKRLTRYSEAYFRIASTRSLTLPDNNTICKPKDLRELILHTGPNILQETTRAELSAISALELLQVTERIENEHPDLYTRVSLHMLDPDIDGHTISPRGFAVLSHHNRTPDFERITDILADELEYSYPDPSSGHILGREALSFRWGINTRYMEDIHETVPTDFESENARHSHTLTDTATAQNTDLVGEIDETDLTDTLQTIRNPFRETE